MDESRKPRRPRTWLFYANILMLVLNAFVVIAVVIAASVTQGAGRQVAVRYGERDMVSAASHGPLSLYTTKQFPDDDSFVFLKGNAEQILVSDEKEDGDSHAPATKKFNLSLGYDFSIWLYYSQTDEIQIHEMRLLKNRNLHHDLNGDGKFDLIMFRSAAGADHVFKILYQDQWQTISPQANWKDLRRTQLSDGRAVEFNVQSGNWELVERNGEVTDEKM